MSIAKNTKETFLEEIIDNLSGNTRELPVDCKPRTREEVLLAEIEKNTRELKNDEPINIDLSNYYTKEETNNLVAEQTNSVINDSDTSSTNTWSSQKIVDYVATVDDVIFEEANGSVVTVNNSVEGYLKNIEILGNTIQDEEDLADIRSVGEKVEGQELYEIPVLSCGKNLWTTNNLENKILNTTHGTITTDTTRVMGDFIKVKPNTDYKLTIPNLFAYNIYFYDKDKNYIRHINNTTDISTRDNECYIVWNGRKTDSSAFDINYLIQQNIQLEEGTVATPYEPYVEDKLTILSPVQLEKVGDVADRIVEKNGVWGVEKNVLSCMVEDFSKFLVDDKLSSVYRTYIDTDINFGCMNRGMISSIVPYNGNISWIVNEEGVYSDDNEKYGYRLWIHINKSKVTSTPEEYVREHLPIKVVYKNVNPTFIPLPHDQQVKLRTFANKTNISFGCEIEGTIKAQVPKSLGATVNTHTEQISNLNKELDRVKKLEESTVSTVETESDFTTVEATSNGYFEDVKLEGKTLVNLCTNNKESYKLYNDSSRQHLNLTTSQDLVVGNQYTIIFTLTDSTGESNAIAFYPYSDADIHIPVNAINGVHKILFTVENTSSMFQFRLTESSYVKGARSTISNIIILEGDHTQNPPSYFEGLKSVGQGADEIVVSSVKGCYSDNEFVLGMLSSATGSLSESGKDWCSSKNFINVEPNVKYNYNITVLGNNPTQYNVFYYQDGKYISNLTIDKSGEFTTPLNANQIKIRYQKYNDITTVFDTIVEIVKFPITEYQADKKRLLFYNEETQTWEKPILREWDSIEKHADGKYYYHQRSGEVVLNGSEDWTLETSTGYLYTPKHDMVRVDNYIDKMLCDKFNIIINKSYNLSGITGYGNLNQYPNQNWIYIKHSDFSDVEGIKKWLQANNVTVVYQLAEEKVYECTNIDLITYANETNYIVESGVIVPRSTLKVHNNISNVVSLLQKKVSLLESNMTSYMITQNRMQLASTYSADSVTFKVDYALCSEETEEYNEDLYNLILNNILVGKDNYNYDKMFNMILDYVTWGQLSFENFDTLVGLMDIQHNPPIDEEVTEEI